MDECQFCRISESDEELFEMDCCGFLACESCHHDPEDCEN